MEFQGRVSLGIGSKGIRDVLHREAGCIRFLRMCHNEGVVRIVPGNRGIEKVGANRRHLVEPNEHVEMERTPLLKFKVVKERLHIF